MRMVNKTKSQHKDTKIGRKRIELDETKIEGLLGIGCTDEELAVYLGVSVDTLTRRFADAIKKGRVKFKHSLRFLQYRAARGYEGEDGKYIPSSVPMLIWLGKQYLDQKDTPLIEKDAPPLNVVLKPHKLAESDE